MIKKNHRKDGIDDNDNKKKNKNNCGHLINLS